MLHAASSARITIVFSVLLSALLILVVVRLRRIRGLWQGGAVLMADENDVKHFSGLQLFLPILTLVGELELPYGLIIYCLAGNILSVMQQYLLRRII